MNSSQENKKTPLFLSSQVAGWIETRKVYYFNFNPGINSKEKLLESLVEINVVGLSKVQQILEIFSSKNVIIFSKNKKSYLNQVIDISLTKSPTLLEDLKLVKTTKFQESQILDHKNYISLGQNDSLDLSLPDYEMYEEPMKNILFGRKFLLNVDNSHILKDAIPIGIFKIRKKRSFLIFQIERVFLFWAINFGMLRNLEVIPVK